jgi:hypothetical protein
MTTVVALSAIAVTGTSAAQSQGVRTADQNSCQSQAAEQREIPVQINLVLDDSGSMIYEGEAITRWSVADYSMQVFVALMRETDQLNVYRLSDFATETGSKREVARISGSESAQDRVNRVQAIDFLGEYTAYGAVTAAYENLKESTAPEKWLVVLTDGAFQNAPKEPIAPEQVEKDLRKFASQPSGDGGKVNVAFLALGPDAPTFKTDPENRIYTDRAVDSEDLLGKVTDFANRIFRRELENLDVDGRWSPDIAMSRVDVFAQGSGVSVEDAVTSDGSRFTPENVDVSWSNNPSVVFEKKKITIEPTPDRSLQGQIGTFADLPAGQIDFQVDNALTTSLFYTPNVFFGFQLTDSAGKNVSFGPLDQEIPPGDYTVNYGFMDESCDFVSDSPFLGDVQSEATLTQEDGGQTNVKDGEVVTLERGAASLTAEASFLSGSSADASVDLNVRNATTALLRTEAAAGAFNVSEMGEFPSPEDGLRVQYVIVEDSGERVPTAEEWATIESEDLVATSDADLEFEVIKENEPGMVTLLTRAPGGDVYAASTGDIDVEVGATRGIEGTENVTPGLVSIQVNDDIDGFDRFMNWLKQSGWKWLLFLLGLILLAGYIFKKRFPKNMKKNPSISGTPNQVGTTPVEERGKFRSNTGRKLLPFVADTGTCTYVPIGTSGFKAFKLKAGPGKSMIVTNYKAIGEKENVEINGNPIDKETKRAPTFRANSTITASTPQMTYDCTPSQ